jgi:hypothetical protein
MTTPKKPKNQGEGDRESAKRYNDDQRQFVSENDERERERLAREARPRDSAEAADMKQAEATGRERSKAGDESGEMSDAADTPRPAAGGGSADADERDAADRPSRNREMRGRDDAGTRRRGRFLRRRR